MKEAIDNAARSATRRARCTLGLRYHLWGLIAATLLPMLAMGALAAWLTSQQIRQTSLERLQATASTLARAVDERFQSQLLQMADQALHAEADGSIQHAGLDLWPGADHGLFEDGSTHWVSDVFQHADGQAPSVAIALPVPGRQQPYVQVQPSSNLIRLLSSSDDSHGALIALLDSRGVLAARSIEPERWIGKSVPDWENLAGKGTPNGHFQATTQEGREIIFAYQKLHAAPGWALVVGEPLEQFRASWTTPIKGILAGGLIALLVALVASHYLARRILHPISLLAKRSRMIAAGSDSPIAPPVSAVTEFELLRQSLSDAETALQQRAEDARNLALELERNQKRYRTVAEAGALVFWEADRSCAMLATAGWHELTGQPESDALGRGWEHSVHPDDLPLIAASWKESVTEGNDLDIEFRIRNADGLWHWVRARGAQVGDLHEPQWAGVLEDVHARRQAQDNLSWLAHHDTLTGLANRVHLRQALHEALATAGPERQVALLCLDLDHFKQVNDTHGHPVGDELLRQVAQRLRQQLREQDQVARLGGDEFAAVLSGPDIAQVCTPLAERIIHAIAAPYRIDGHVLHIGVSIGICTTDDASMSRETLHQRADQALYAAKQQGRSRFVVVHSGACRDAGTPVQLPGR